MPPRDRYLEKTLKKVSLLRAGIRYVDQAGFVFTGIYLLLPPKQGLKACTTRSWVLIWLKMELQGSWLT